MQLVGFYCLYFFLVEADFAGIDNEGQRRDSLHAIINGLPDPNYATLRALVLVSWFL